MRWLDSACDGSSYVAYVGPFEFLAECVAINRWRATYSLEGHTWPIGDYRTEKQAKTFAYRRAKALVERMVREVRDP